MNEEPIRQCRQAGCGGPISGQCLEHFPFDECPNLINLEDPLAPLRPPEDPETGDANGDPALELVQVSVGPAFSMRQADSFLRRGNAVVVSLLAGPEAGKTTLLVAMYELARRRALLNLSFAGSESIRGFEERCHLSRHSSGGDHADTQRTRSGPPQFLHLRLKDSIKSFDLLLADRAGEFITRVLDQPDTIATLPEISRADHLLLLVDGAELIRNLHQTNSTAKRTFQALKQNDLLGSRPLHLVVTKRDIFSGTQLHLLEQRAQLLADFISEIHPPTQLHLTGARRREGESNLGEGIESLLQALAPKAEQPLFASPRSSRSTHINDALSRFMDAMDGSEQ